ncbi:MAG: hypothetical protein LBL21_00280 [Rickettsiales bacterium]|nr:hypothetical protein [Rickettsiales bacterium]
MKNEGAQGIAFRISHPEGRIDIKSSGDKCAAPAGPGPRGCPARGMILGFKDPKDGGLSGANPRTYDIAELGKVCRSQLEHAMDCICSMCRRTTGRRG